MTSCFKKTESGVIPLVPLVVVGVVLVILPVVATLTMKNQNVGKKASGGCGAFGDSCGESYTEACIVPGGFGGSRTCHRVGYCNAGEDCVFESSYCDECVSQWIPTEPPYVPPEPTSPPPPPPPQQQQECKCDGSVSPGSHKCDGENVFVCQNNSGNCFWRMEKECSSSETCQSGSCIPRPTEPPPPTLPPLPTSTPTPVCDYYAPSTCLTHCWTDCQRNGLCFSCPPRPTSTPKPTATPTPSCSFYTPITCGAHCWGECVPQGSCFTCPVEPTLNPTLTQKYLETYLTPTIAPSVTPGPTNALTDTESDSECSTEGKERCSLNAQSIQSCLGGQWTNTSDCSHGCSESGGYPKCYSIPCYDLSGNSYSEGEIICLNGTVNEYFCKSGHWEERLCQGGTYCDSYFKGCVLPYDQRVKLSPTPTPATAQQRTPGMGDVKFCESCPFGCDLEKGICKEPDPALVCQTEGEKSCSNDGNFVQNCQKNAALGKNLWEKSFCGNGCDGISFTCRLACQPGETRCASTTYQTQAMIYFPGTRLQCKADGSAFEQVESCPLGCDANSGRSCNTYSEAMAAAEPYIAQQEETEIANALNPVTKQVALQRISNNAFSDLGNSLGIVGAGALYTGLATLGNNSPQIQVPTGLSSTDYMQELVGNEVNANVAATQYVSGISSGTKNIDPNLIHQVSLTSYAQYSSDIYEQWDVKSNANLRSQKYDPNVDKNFDLAKRAAFDAVLEMYPEEKVTFEQIKSSLETASIQEVIMTQKILREKYNFPQTSLVYN